MMSKVDGTGTLLAGLRERIARQELNEQGMLPVTSGRSLPVTATNQYFDRGVLLQV
jgi:hypothetical protein